MIDTPKTALLGGEVVAVPSQYSLKDVARFIDNIQIPTNPIACWKWAGLSKPDGYGVFYANRGQIAAHRFMHELYHGPIPEGYHVHHLCSVRDCVNPRHLIAVTPSEHVLEFTHDSFAARNVAKQFCVRGHPLIEGNLRSSPDGHRRCLTCVREDAAAKRAIERSTRGPKIKTSCKYGHEWTEDNIGTDTYGRQFCKTCRKESANGWYARKKANAEPKREKRSTHCKRGHELTPDNIYKWIDKKTGKECWTCHQCKKDAMRGYKRKELCNQPNPSPSATTPSAES